MQASLVSPDKLASKINQFNKGGTLNIKTKIINNGIRLNDFTCDNKKIPNKFIGKKDLDNLYFVSSLNGKSLFLIKFGANNERIMFKIKALFLKNVLNIAICDGLFYFSPGQK